MTIDLRDEVFPHDGPRTRDPFAGGLLTVMVVPTDATLDEGLAVLQREGLRVWTERLPVPAGETVLVAGMPCREAPSTDALADVNRHVLSLLDTAGIDVEVRGSGYVSAEAVARWGGHHPS
jgi:hypothetical protein